MKDILDKLNLIIEQTIPRLYHIIYEHRIKIHKITRRALHSS